MSLLAALAVLPPANAKDLLSLSRLLTPAYTAMNYAAVCASHPPWAVSQPTGSRGTAVNYAEHVKDEIIAGLSYDEALKVLRLAADDARADTRERLRASVAVDQADVKAVGLKSWCEGYATGFIAALIETHDNNHEAFLEQLRQSKFAR
ncbi:MAG: hypothetical protein K2Y27_24085 [Xanthobacteraceae bacterium]|nr:hypothetical protein [Xanthobacteraceae bacterium]